MSRAAKLEQIKQLSVKASQKRMSELTELEQHAVYFLGNRFGAVLVEDEVLKYDRNAPEYAIVTAYIDARRINTGIGGTSKFSSKTSLVFEDKVVEFEQADVLTALDAYPDKLLIPVKDLTTDLPPIKKVSKKVTDPKGTIGGQIAHLYVNLVKDIERTTADKAIHKVISKNKDQFLELCDTLALSTLALGILNFKPELKSQHPGSLEYSTDTISMSYLATYIYYASKGIFLLAEKE